MNILKILTLNKHGAFEEVLFSSALSYLITPQFDHGLGTSLLRKIVGQVHSDIEETELIAAKVTSEYSFEEAGNIDIFIEIDKAITAIEVKIWDRSAKNVSQDGTPQLERYCHYLSDKYKDRKWALIFLIPNIDSPICQKEFEKASSVGFEGKLHLATWNPFDSDMNTGHIITQSISEMIEEVYDEIPRVDMPLHTQMILDSLLDVLPDLLGQIKDEGRFPSKTDLEKLGTWNTFEAFFRASNRWPNPLHTAVGIPFESGDHKSQLHGNSLYRVRTTQDYYDVLPDKQKHLPYERVELELWEDVYENSKGKIRDWMEALTIDQKALSQDVHIDSKKKDKVILLQIEKGKIVTEKDVDEFNHIMRGAFHKMV